MMNLENPLISVIVPVYNVEQYLKTCVDSVLNQSYKNWELILVDDGSPDNCPEICDEYAVKDDRIKVIHKENGGLSSARNAALDIATGEYITFLDSDDFWHNDYLSIMIGLCLQYNADIAQCSYIRGASTTFPEMNKKQNVKVFDNHSIFLEGYAKIIMCAKLYKRNLFDGIRLPEGKINEDDFTTWKFYYRGKRILVTNKSLYYYTVNEKGIMANQLQMPRLDYLEAYEERIEFFREKGIEDLEDFSRGHFCKALLLTSGNPMLSVDQRSIVNEAFTSNWLKIRYSKYLPLRLRFLFYFFRIMPGFTLWLVNKLR